MSAGNTSVTVQCSPIREYFSASNIKSILRGFVYEYETPKIVTIHSISIALMCRLIQLLILVYGIVYLMIHKKGYQETDTSIISSITLKVKGIGYNQTARNQTLVVDGADYIVPPQENNALFLMTNFIRTDQEHDRCPETPDERESFCTNDSQCILNRNFQKANGKWTGKDCVHIQECSDFNLLHSGRCVILQNVTGNVSGRCELEGWCPVENDRDIPLPIRDALNFTIFVKNFIEFPRFKVIRKNIQANASYLKGCNFEPVDHPTCPIFRVGTILNMVEPDPDEQAKMLTSGGVIRVKIDWKCNLDKSLNFCIPEYSFGRLDARYRDESFSQGFNFRFASHWKHQNRSYRTLTKAFGLRFIISVSGHAGRFDIITLTLNIGSLIGILGLATFICDIVALYVHRQSDVYRQQKFQDVDLNLLRLETLNTLPMSMMSEEAKRKHANHVEQAILSGHVIDNPDATPSFEQYPKNKNNREKSRQQQEFYDGASFTSKDTNNQSTPMLIYGNYHQQRVALTNSVANDTPVSSIKQRRPQSNHRPTQLPFGQNDKNQFFDKTNIVFVDEDTPDTSEQYTVRDFTEETPISDNHVPFNYTNTTRLTPKIETFL